MYFLTILTVLAALVPNTHMASISGDRVAEMQPRLPQKELAEKIREFFPDEPRMVDVARCESTMRQFDKNGDVVRSGTDDVGVFQINEYFHRETAARMGMDIYTTDGNISYARYLYDKNGLHDWSASKPCWGASS